MGSKRLPPNSIGAGKTGQGPAGFGTEKGGEMPVGVVFTMRIPPHWRQLSKKEIRRKLANPANLDVMLDAMADTIDHFFKKPVNYRELVRNLAGIIDASDQG